MANDIPEVYIRVVADTGEVQRNLSAAEKAFLGFQKSTKKGRKSWGGSLTKQFASMAGGVFAVSTAMSALSSIAKAMFKDVSDFQTMSVELKVATGSAVHAEQAFSMLQDTAKMLPTSLKDLTTGFVRLKNMGLDASQRSLVSFANTAAAMGKSLKQFVEAVADANTREFERLKEFGILARNEGDKIKFVFRGVTTEVDNSSKDIVQFLTNIGNTEFAGAATEQIDTLSSRVTKLKDSLFNLNVALGSDGAGAVGDFFKLIEDKANAAAEAINMDKLQTKLTSVVKFDGGGAAWMGQGGSGGIIRVSKSISEIRNVFKKLNAKELPLAAKLIEEQKDLVDEMRESEHEDLRKQRSKLHWMVRGLKVSRERLRVQIVSAAEKAKEVADGAHSIRIDQQREQINKSFQERAFQLRLRAANQQKNILALVELETDIRVLVMGVRGEEHREGQLGAHLETVIRALHKPVLVVNAAFAVPKKIMLAYDGQDASRKALDMVASSPVFKDIPCHLVYVGDESTASSVLNEAAAVLQTAGVSHELVNLPKGKSDEQLCHYQAENDIDLTVMGAYSHHPLRDMLLGSLTAKMLHKTKRPLLLLR